MDSEVSVLPNTSLCAIVRDEVRNPAGGIKRFVRHVMPHVPQGVIVDTGSVDGTRRELEELEEEFPHLTVYDHVFNGFADARNYALERTHTRRALILDADEVITRKGFRLLRKTLLDSPDSHAHIFDFVGIRPSGVAFNQKNVHSYRLFDVGRMVFMGMKWELALKRGVGGPFRENLDGLPNIYHFLPSIKADELKTDQLYDSIDYHGSIPESSPYEAEGFDSWKRFNSRRNLVQFS